MPTDQRQMSRRRDNSSRQNWRVDLDPADTDSIVELSLKLAAAARKRSPKTWPVTHLLKTGRERGQ
jgi:hypothetical protein